ncbi:MAG: hypothetical protein R3E47_15535 [Paracoccaceae bacterium]
MSETGPDLLGLVEQFLRRQLPYLPEFALLEQVLKDQFDLDGDRGRGTARRALPQAPKDIPCDTVGNPDPDASYNTEVWVMPLSSWKPIAKTMLRRPRKTPDLITHVAVHIR